MAKVVYGPESSFYDNREDDEIEEFEILEEEDGLFFQFVNPNTKKRTAIVGCTLVRPQLKKLIKVLEREVARIKKGGN